VRYTDEELDDIAGYGGPRDGLASALLSDLRSARSEIATLKASLARPIVADAVRTANRADLIARQKREIEEQEASGDIFRTRAD
jgi:hypothetical protein